MNDNAGGRRARGELESEVMAALWAADGPMTPAETQSALGGGLAYSTVQTILIRLLDKGMVLRRAGGRGKGHVYWPAQDAATTVAERMRAVLAGRADRLAVLQQFAAGLDDADADVLRALLEERRP